MISFFDEVHSSVYKNDSNAKRQININAKLIDIIKYDYKKDIKKVFSNRNDWMFDFLSETVPNYNKSVLQGIKNSYTTLDNSNELTIFLVGKKLQLYLLK